MYEHIPEDSDSNKQYPRYFYFANKTRISLYPSSTLIYNIVQRQATIAVCCISLILACSVEPPFLISPHGSSRLTLSHHHLIKSRFGLWHNRNCYAGETKSLATHGANSRSHPGLFLFSLHPSSLHLSSLLSKYPSRNPTLDSFVMRSFFEDMT